MRIIVVGEGGAHSSSPNVRHLHIVVLPAARTLESSAREEGQKTILIQSSAWIEDVVSRSSRRPLPRLHRGR